MLMLSNANAIQCQMYQGKYSSLSNNHAGCNKRAGWKNLQNLGDFKNKLMFKSHQRLS